MSQAEPQSTVIGGHDYSMHMLPPMESHNLLMDVVKMVGPSLGPVFDMFYGTIKAGDAALDEEVPIEFFTKAASALFGELDKAVLNRVIDSFKNVTVVENVGRLSKTFDAHFQGNLHEMYEWLGWGMSVQWGKSLSALVGAVGNRSGIAAAMATRKKEKES
jgi:hypothetical protein